MISRVPTDRHVPRFLMHFHSMLLTFNKRIQETYMSLIICLLVCLSSFGLLGAASKKPYLGCILQQSALTEMRHSGLPTAPTSLCRHYSHSQRKKAMDENLLRLIQYVERSVLLTRVCGCLEYLHLKINTPDVFAWFFVAISSLSAVHH